MSNPVIYEEAHIALLRALPELQPAYDEMLTDWDNFGGGPPGQYNLFNNLLEPWIEVLLRISPETRGRNEALGRAMEFGESLLASTDVESRSLGRDTFVSPFVPPWGREAAESLGGQHLKRILAEDYNADYSNINFVNVIDLWGVRDVLAPLLPDLRLPDLPGVSNPRDGRELPSLAEAKTADDGAALLCDFGWTYLFVAARASAVRCSHEALEAAAVALSPSFRLRPDSVPETGRPRVRYVRIPIGERVWNLTSPDWYHVGFDMEVWIAESLLVFEDQIRLLVDGQIDELVT